MTPNETIAEMVRRIVKKFLPHMVILFGSYARGEATKDSDVDLAVIFPRLPAKRREKAIRIQAELNGMGMAKDVIVVAKADLEEEKNLVGTIGNILASEGKVLYSRA